MPHYSVQSDPDDNPHFQRDWGDGPVFIRLRSERLDPPTTLTKTEDAKAAEPKAAA